MKRFIYLLTILVLFFFSLQLNAQEDRKNRLLKELVKTPHDSTRLKILQKLTKITKYHEQTRLYYLKQFKEEAENQGNDFYRCNAYLYGMIFAYNKYDVAGVKYWNSLLEPVARDNKFYDILFQGKRCVIDFLQLTGEYEKEERESLALLKEAEEVGSKQGMIMGYQSLGNAYFISYRYEEASQAFEKGYRLSSELGSESSSLGLLNSLITVSERVNDVDSWLKYIKLEEKTLQKKIQVSSVNPATQSAIFMMYVHYLAYYVRVGKMEEASRYYQLAEKSYYASGESGIYKEYFMRIGSSYFNKSKQYDKALAYSDTLLDLLRPVSGLAYNDALAAHASILFSMGRDREALYHFKEAKAGRDSSQLQILNTQTEQVKTIHNIYLLELEKEQNKQYLQWTILVFLIISILTIASFIIYRYRISRRLKRDENEMRKMTNEVEQANQAKERFLSNISTSIGKPLDTVVENSLFLASDQKIDDNKRIVISEVISKTSAELMQLINHILDISRLEAGMMRFILSDVEVFSLIQDAATGISIEQKRKINIVCPQSALFWSHIDGPRLLNVFNNLFVSVLPDRELQVAVEVSEDETELMIKVYGSSLTSRDLSQELIILNEINRMIINHFKGVYENKPNARIPYVYFTINGNFTPFELG